MSLLNRIFDRIFGNDRETTLLFCECNDVDCLLMLPIDEQTYLDTRARYPRAAMVLLGHQDDVDEVLEIHEGYMVVQVP